MGVHLMGVYLMTFQILAVGVEKEFSRFDPFGIPGPRYRSCAKPSWYEQTVAKDKCTLRISTPTQFIWHT
jgi:hypothetical protein